MSIAGYLIKVSLAYRHQKGTLFGSLFIARSFHLAVAVAYVDRDI
jgi:hypothetical protein